MVAHSYYKQLQHRGKMITSRVAEGVFFLRRFVGAPRQVGSVTPSSRFLTREMMDKIQWNSPLNIAELGAGTGVVTRSILQMMTPGEGNLLVFEIDPVLKAMLEKEYGNRGLTVYGDARELPEIMEKRGIASLDYVVSSLPFAVLPPRVTASILDTIDSTLKPEGKLVAYQYSRHMKPYLKKRFESVKISFVLRNVPPAFVYECSIPKKHKKLAKE